MIPTRGFLREPMFAPHLAGRGFSGLNTPSPGPIFLAGAPCEARRGKAEMHAMRHTQYMLALRLHNSRGRKIHNRCTISKLS